MVVIGLNHLGTLLITNNLSIHFSAGEAGDLLGAAQAVGGRGRVQVRAGVRLPPVRVRAVALQHRLPRRLLRHPLDQEQQVYIREIADRC